jgi:signal transduction histidine kinase
MMTSIARRLAIPFVGFVIAGSLSLVWWLGNQEQRASRKLFTVTARTNADFVRKENLPPSQRTAAALGDVLGMRVQFVSGPTAPDLPGATAPELAALATLPDLSPGEVLPLDRLHVEAVSLPIVPGTAMYFFRSAPSNTGFLTQPRTLLTLGGFWALSLALAWVLASGIVRPLRAFAARLPRIAEESAEPLPEAARDDEIGQLARAYAETRAQLADERCAREQAERLATLGRMATGLAHEINNPVAAIKLHAQLLEGEVASAPPERLEIILAEAAKIESLVSQWMFLARPQPPQTKPCDLGELVADCMRSLEPAARHAGVQVENRVTPGLVASVDRRRMAQAITNIITNAIHAMAGTGGKLSITAELSGAAVEFHFADTGPGFSKEALIRATELFYSEKEGGMGIGLSVTSEILRAHGGNLTLANLPEGGAVVGIRLDIEAPSFAPSHVNKIFTNPV